MRGLLTFICIVFAAALQAQHHLGTMVLDVNGGVEAYNSSNTYSVKRVDGVQDTTIDATAGNGNASVALEIGIGKFIGIGVRGKTNVFFRSLDAVMNSRADISSTDLLGMINLHPLSFKKFDLVLGAEFGLSKLKFDANDPFQTLVTGKGGYFAIYLNPRFFIKRFGFNLRAGLPVFNYADLQRSNDAGNYIISKWKASGLGISVGLQYRFF